MERGEFERLFGLLDERGKILVQELIDELWKKQQLEGPDAKE